MTGHRYFHSLKKGRLPKSAGSKAINLLKLHEKGMRIPVTYVCDWHAHQQYLAANDTNLLPRLRNELRRFVVPNKKYVVRSSANIEDGFERSFAGQFKSVLNCTGVENILQAMISVWSSAQTQEVRAYLERHGIPDDQILMAIIIQEMVEPLYSGVALSKNPVTGSDEIVIEAIEGEGPRLMQTGITPERWVNKWGYWREKSESSVVPFSLIQQIASETKKISDRLQYPVDLEWVYDGNHLYWVQMRKITAYNTKNVYSNHIPREYLPGMIKPLIFSVNIPLINTVWINMLGEITGDLGIEPGDLAKSFYYRTYFNMGVLGNIFKGLGFPSESVEMLMGILPRGTGRPHMAPSWKTLSCFPRMIRFFIDKWNFGSKMRRALPGLIQRVRAVPYLNLDGMTAPDLLNRINNHLKLMREVAYYNVIGPLLMMMYNRVLKGQLAKRDIDINNFDLTENMPEIRFYDPATDLGNLKKKFRSFPPEIQEKIRLASYEDFQALEGLESFRDDLTEVLQRFGHLSNNGNDFSAIPWRETPEMVLKMMIDFEPQKEESKQKIHWADLQARRQAGYMLKLFYRRAREFRLFREQVSELYTYGYGLFRYYYLAIGEHLVRQGVIDEPTDIFYLIDKQVHSIVNGSVLEEDVRSMVMHHKSEMQRLENIETPPVIYGDEIPPIRNPSQKVLHGVPTSIGYCVGPVVTVKGVQDFYKVKTGDVLVIPYSEVSWSPLFARAGAVVAESGGLLSHSSIVAREYNIPAVVSVEGATGLADGTRVAVDGQKGDVIILSP